MRNYSLTLALLVGLGGMAAGFAGDLTGKVILKGTPAAEREINMSADPKCGALHTEPVATRFYVTAPDGGLGDVLVYVKAGLEEKEWPMPEEKALLDQKGCEYDPYVMGVRVGQVIQIRNSDPTLHNVHATPKINHPWMFAYVGVFDHPFFAVTDEKGNFKISNLPDGKYTLVAYHRKTHNTEEGVLKEITVTGDSTVELTVEIK